VTNIVKWTGENADLPDSKKVQLFLPILRREIELVLPKYIVTFGLIPFTYLTGEKIRLADYYDWVMTNNRLRFYEYAAEGTLIRVIPCYFPVGRGDPKRAVTILKRIAELVQS
jgi:uracil-DNA glycosylase family 4